MAAMSGVLYSATTSLDGFIAGPGNEAAEGKHVNALGADGPPSLRYRVARMQPSNG